MTSDAEPSFLKKDVPIVIYGTSVNIDGRELLTENSDGHCPLDDLTEKLKEQRIVGDTDFARILLHCYDDLARETYNICPVGILYADFGERLTNAQIDEWIDSRYGMPCHPLTAAYLCLHYEELLPGRTSSNPIRVAQKLIQGKYAFEIHFDLGYPRLRGVDARDDKRPNEFNEYEIIFCHPSKNWGPKPRL